MFERFNHYWRLFGTGLSFFLFGAVGVVFWGMLFPLMAPFLGQSLQKQLRSRWLMQQIFRIYMNFMQTIGILSYQVHGKERLACPGRLVIANHPCLLDIVFLLSQIPNATCIVKPALAGNPFMRIPIRAMGYIYAESAQDLMARCVAELQAGSALIIFPEGTRTTPGQALKFQRGAANIALQAQVPILPIRLSCNPTTLTKQEKWYQIPARRFKLSIETGEEITLDSRPKDAERSLLARRLTRQLEDYFKQKAG